MEYFREYHEKSKLTTSNCEEFAKIAAWVSYKGMDYININKYDFSEIISLEDVVNVESNRKLEDIILKRRSVRSFKTEQITITELTYILKYSLGLCGHSNNYPLYVYPSAGAINSIKNFVVLNNVKDVSPGLYVYIPETHSLGKINDSSGENLYCRITASNDIANQSAFSIHLLGRLEPKCIKYQERGYRFLLLECGHIAQNICLCAENLGLGCVVSGGYFDELDESLEQVILKDENVFMFYEVFLGYPQKNI